MRRYEPVICLPCPRRFFHNLNQESGRSSPRPYGDVDITSPLLIDSGKRARFT